MEAFDYVCQRRIVQYLEILDLKKSHLPLSCCEPHPATTASDAQEPAIVMRRQLAGDWTGSGAVLMDGLAILQADETTDARLINKIVNTAKAAGFDNLLFAVKNK